MLFLCGSIEEYALLTQRINNITGGDNCAMVYGKLPPDTKVQQAELFNSGKLKYLVSTDAIGMGLNLNIKRIVFTTLLKRNNGQTEALSMHQIKQIAGRAGRLGDEGGMVAYMKPRDKAIIKGILSNVNKNLQDSNDLQNLDLSIAQIEADKTEEAEKLLPDFPTENAEITEAKVQSEGSSMVKVYHFGSSQPNLVSSKSFFDPEFSSIKQAVLFPSFQHIFEFNRNLEIIAGREVPFSELIKKMGSIAKLGGLYSFQNYENMLIVGDY